MQSFPDEDPELRPWITAVLLALGKVGRAFRKHVNHFRPKSAKATRGVTPGPIAERTNANSIGHWFTSIPSLIFPIAPPPLSFSGTKLSLPVVRLTRMPSSEEYRKRAKDARNQANTCLSECERQGLLTIADQCDIAAYKDLTGGLVVSTGRTPDIKKPRVSPPSTNGQSVSEEPSPARSPFASSCFAARACGLRMSTCNARFLFRDAAVRQSWI